MTPQLSTKYVFTITARIGEVTSTGESAPVSGGLFRSSAAR
jgi:hypothetical protein